MEEVRGSSENGTNDDVDAFGKNRLSHYVLITIPPVQCATSSSIYVLSWERDESARFSDAHNPPPPFAAMLLWRASLSDFRAPY